LRPSGEHEVGHVERRRCCSTAKAVFAGTRVPVTAVEAYFERGLPDERILEAFPS